MALGHNPEQGGFLHNDKDPLPYDLIIADEYSMVDTRLANSLLRAIGEASLIVVGDVDQLPSVDAGRRSEEHTSELQSLMRSSYAVFCLKKKRKLKSTRTQYVQTPIITLY